MSKRAYGTHEIARLCHVSPPTIGRWMEEGKIPSFKTAGGHRRVWDVDLAAFLREYGLPVPADMESSVRPCILIVDDEPEMRRFVTRAVQKVCPEADIREAVDGFDAGHKISSFIPAVVILDLRLPGMDGVRVCRTVRSDARLKAVKILAMTGYGIEESQKEAMEAGTDEFLPKPFDAVELAEKLKKILGPVPAGSER